MENKKKNAPDNRTIDLSDDYAVEYWIQELKTTKSKLAAAVAEAGESYEAVKRQLRK